MPRVPIPLVHSCARASLVTVVTDLRTAPTSTNVKKILRYVMRRRRVLILKETTSANAMMDILAMEQSVKVSCIGNRAFQVPT